MYQMYFVGGIKWKTSSLRLSTTDPVVLTYSRKFCCSPPASHDRETFQTMTFQLTSTCTSWRAIVATRHENAASRDQYYEENRT